MVGLLWPMTPGEEWGHKVRYRKEGTGSGRRPDYFKILATPIVLVAITAYMLIFMSPPFWIVVGSLALVVIVLVAAYASLDLSKSEYEREAKYGKDAAGCEICGVRIGGLEYERHLWMYHPQEARKLKALTHEMLVWIIGGAALTCAVIFLIVGFSFASFVVMIIVSPMIGFVMGIGVVFGVRWPRVAARANVEWQETHPGSDGNQATPPKA